MKHYLLLSLLVIAFASCKKKDKNTTPPPSLAGTWEVTAEASLSSLAAPARLIVVKFTGNTYERYVNGALVTNGTYKVAPDKYPNNTPAYRIVFDGSLTTQKVFYKIAGNELTVTDDPYLLPPGGLMFYKRIN